MLCLTIVLMSYIEFDLVQVCSIIVAVIFYDTCVLKVYFYSLAVWTLLWYVAVLCYNLKYIIWFNRTYKYCFKLVTHVYKLESEDLLLYLF